MFSAFTFLYHMKIVHMENIFYAGKAVVGWNVSSSPSVLTPTKTKQKTPENKIVLITLSETLFWIKQNTF